MKPTRVVSVCAIIMSLFFPEFASAQSAVGDWMGTLKVSGIELRIVFKIKAGDDGNYSATMDSIDQGALDLPMNLATVEDRQVRLEMKAISGVYEGTLSEDGQTISGTWTQGPAQLPLDLKRLEEEIVLHRPQEPKPPYPYTNIEVAYDNPRAEGVRLAGTLSIPAGDGPHPVVLFITGSGPQNRNEELMGHKPFLVMSDYLVRRGIATLRVDDRGVGGSKGATGNETSFDFADDVLAGVEFLKTRAEIDPERIGLLGHSEGGLIAPMVASGSSDVAFIVLLAGPAVTGEEIISLQSELILRAQGAPESAIIRATEMNGRVYALAREETDPERLEAGLRVIYEDLTPIEKASVNVEAVVAQVSTPWFKAFLAYDPRPVLQKVSCPVLALFGEKDLQVPPSQSMPEMEKALAASGSQDVDIVELLGLNHLFQNCATGSPTEYAQIEQTTAPAALEMMSEWIADRFVD